MDKDDHSNGHGNGNGSDKTDELVLRFDRATTSLAISGHVYNIDTALAMLAMATREYERQLRTQQAMQLQAELRQAAQDAQIAAALRTGRG
jgi:hypothetical protein